MPSPVFSSASAAGWEMAARRAMASAASRASRRVRFWRRWCSWGSRSRPSRSFATDWEVEIMPLILASFGCGLVFGLGLLISGMTEPEKVLGFLDVFGAWDATLAFVMAGAVLGGG